MKKAMVRMPGALREAGLAARMVLQVHDELLFEVAVEECEQTLQLVKSVMEDVITLDVPLVAEGKFADSWAEAH